MSDDLGRYRPLSYYQSLEWALTDILVEKGVLTREQVAAQVADMAARSPARGARLIAHAWNNAAFEQRLLTDAPAACAELGLDVGPLKLIAVKNTPTLHNVIVCTLCSCYPRMLMGVPPEWYKSRAYRARVVREPREVLKEFGTEIAENVEVRVHDSTADMRYLVIPERPEGTRDWLETQLATLISRDSMIGVARALPASAAP
jgi:nitrile hydratase subunit alpha